uniref:Histonelysine Nmethyltransferase SETMARlike [Bombyx mori] n=1 Tax=Lepeophtheirus salmonis TaxID=72036 RepID=A0A0K2U5A5_LEPSM
MPKPLAISSTFTLLSSLIISWILSMISAGVTSTRKFSVTCACIATLKILKPHIICSNRRCRVPIIFIKLLFSILRRCNV